MAAFFNPTKSHPSLPPVVCSFLAICVSNYLRLPTNTANTCVKALMYYSSANPPQTGEQNTLSWLFIAGHNVPWFCWCTQKVSDLETAVWCQVSFPDTTNNIFYICRILPFVLVQIWEFSVIYCFYCWRTCECLCTWLCICMLICVQVCLITVSVYLSQWVVTVKVLHLVGLLLQSVLWEQPSAHHFSEEHYTFWCFNPFFPLLLSFCHTQTLNLISRFLLPHSLFAGVVNFQLKWLKFSRCSSTKRMLLFILVITENLVRSRCLNHLN